MKKKKQKRLKLTKKQRIEQFKSIGGIEKITLTCSHCKQPFEINTSKPELYTEELCKTWLCLSCKDNKRNASK